jgi:hypothetical protein
LKRSPKKDTRALATFTYPTKVTVHATEFKLLDSVRHLDLAALEKATHAEIEIGEIKTDCCQHLVRAMIRKGMVTELRIAATAKSESTPETGDFGGLLKVVRQKLQKQRKPGSTLPMPVRQFLGSAVYQAIETATCVRICFFNQCYECCINNNTGRLYCGRIWIDGTDNPFPEP